VTRIAVPPPAPAPDHSETEELKFLSESERYAYGIFLKTQEAEISKDTAEGMYALFQAGKDCKEIQRLNPGFKYGQIVAARVRHHWDVRKAEHRKRLEEDAINNFAITHREGAELARDAITVLIKLNTDAFKKFIQSGNPKDLDGTMLEKGATFAQFEKLLELMGSLNEKADRLSPTRQAAPQAAPATPTLPEPVPAAPIEGVSHKSLLERLGKDKK
jgi:hypothetical protein